VSGRRAAPGAPIGKASKKSKAQEHFIILESSGGPERFTTEVGLPGGNFRLLY
jgi:hypothetical protein